MSEVRIRYKYGTSTYDIYVDKSVDPYTVIEKNPFYIQNKKIISYTTNESPSRTLYPLQLISTPTSNIELTLTNESIEPTGKVQIKDPETNALVADISDLVLNLVMKEGKNQPFSYVVMTISKQLFLDMNIELVQKTTPFDINLYGITGRWIFERVEDQSSMYVLTLVNPAYYLKTITLLSLFNINTSSTITNTVDFTNLNILNNPISWNNPDGTAIGTTNISANGDTLTVKIKRVPYTTSDNQRQYKYTLMKLDCTVDGLFRFLSTKVAKYSSDNVSIDRGYYYNIISGGSVLVQDTYTLSEMDALKAADAQDDFAHRNWISTSAGTDTIFKNVSLRFDEFCWDVLKSLALLTNREIIFSDKAYLVPMTVDSSKKISIDWEPPSSSDSYVHPKILALAENDDQGSQYVLASQKVQCEAYQTTVAISDTTSTYVAQDLVFPGADNTDENNTPNINANRNNQAKIIAFNSLMKNFKPGDCVVYSVSETKELPTPSNTYTTWPQTLPTASQNGCFKYQVLLGGQPAIETYYVAKNPGGTYQWFEYDADNPERIPSSDQNRVNESVKEVKDEHNNITLTNVPLAQVEVEYPACVTTYTWGNPEFMDEQNQFTSLSALAQDSVLDNTSDTGISSSDATKIVVGNQYVHQLQDDRSGFTGLILEKNLDNNIYRLVGYDDGAIQTQFNSEGKIVAGANLVTLSDTGISIGSSPSGSPTSISLNEDSTILITDNDTQSDDSVIPAVSIAASGSFFKNDVVFDKSITVDESITIGDQGSRISAGSLEISLTDPNNQTQTFTSPTVVTSPAEGEAIAGTYSEHRFTTTFNNLTGGSSMTMSPTINAQNITWVANNTNIANILLGKSTGNVTFSYITAKNPEKYPQIDITNMHLKVNSESGSTITPNTILETYPVVTSTPYQIPSTSIISLPISWQESTAGALNESIQITIGYTTKSFTYTGTGTPTIGNQSSVKYISSVISLSATRSAGSTYADIKIPSTFSLSTSGLLTGTFLYSIESLQILVRLPLSRQVSFSSFRVGTLGMSSAGNMIVSKYGVWGSTTVAVRNGSSYEIRANPISPLVNTNYFEDHISSATVVYTMSNETTPYSDLGLKRIVAIPYGTQPPTLSYRSGDIILYYTT